MWALILGFLLAAGVQARVHRDRVVELLGDDRPKTIAVASALGGGQLVVFVRRGRARPQPDPKGRP